MTMVSCFIFVCVVLFKLKFCFIITFCFTLSKLCDDSVKQA